LKKKNPREERLPPCGAACDKKEGKVTGRNNKSKNRDSMEGTPGATAKKLCAAKGGGHLEREYNLRKSQFVWAALERVTGKGEARTKPNSKESKAYGSEPFNTESRPLLLNDPIGALNRKVRPTGMILVSKGGGTIPGTKVTFKIQGRPMGGHSVGGR